MYRHAYLLCVMLVTLVPARLLQEHTQSNNNTFHLPQRIAALADSIKPPKRVDTALYFAALHRIARADASGRWPVKAVVPLEGALLPFYRVVAYYGNFYCRQMGILGELPEAQLLQHLKQQCAAWQKADPLTPVKPAIHYIAVTAQSTPCDGKKYRLRMPAKEIEKAIALAQKINGLVFLDVQVGQSTLQEELPLLEKYLILPQVHLSIDPEFSMKAGQRPGTAIGTFDASDVNYAAGLLAQWVKKHNLPPKILVIHRFTERMLTNYQQIVKRPEVQLVINMDGFGAPELKKKYVSCFYLPSARAVNRLQSILQKRCSIR